MAAVDANGAPNTGEHSLGATLLLVIGEPSTVDQKELILQSISTSLRSCEGCDINAALLELVGQAPTGEEGPNGERILEHLSVTVLINPQLQTVTSKLRSFLSAPAARRHLVYSGLVLHGHGGWFLQDDLFTFEAVSAVLSEADVHNALQSQPGSSLSIHTPATGHWSETQVKKLNIANGVQVKFNPAPGLEEYNGITEFVNYLSSFVKGRSCKELLQTSEVVGNIRFSKPTLYIFPGGQGDSALFGISGFNLLVNGGYNRKASFWDFTRHLDRIDACILTHLGADNLFGASSVFERKAQDNIHPEVGYIYFNALEKSIKHSPNGDSHPENGGSHKPASLLVNLVEQGNLMLENLRQLGQVPNPCVGAVQNQVLQPLNLYHKVGHGSLDMYVLNPLHDARELKDFLAQWGKHVNTFTSTKTGFPLPNYLSICALLIWRPSSAHENITRILFPGSAPQQKVFEGLDKLKALDVLKYASCTETSLHTTLKPQRKGPAPAAKGPAKTPIPRHASSPTPAKKDPEPPKRSVAPPHSAEKKRAPAAKTGGAAASKPAKDAKNKVATESSGIREKKRSAASPSATSSAATTPPATTPSPVAEVAPPAPPAVEHHAVAEQKPAEPPVADLLGEAASESPPPPVQEPTPALAEPVEQPSSVPEPEPLEPIHSQPEPLLQEPVKEPEPEVHHHQPDNTETSEPPVTEPEHVNTLESPVEQPNKAEEEPGASAQQSETPATAVDEVIPEPLPDPDQFDAATFAAVAAAQGAAEEVDHSKPEAEQHVDEASESHQQDGSSAAEPERQPLSPTSEASTAEQASPDSMTMSQKQQLEDLGIFDVGTEEPAHGTAAAEATPASQGLEDLGIYDDGGASVEEEEHAGKAGQALEELGIYDDSAASEEAARQQETSSRQTMEDLGIFEEPEADQAHHQPCEQSLLPEAEAEPQQQQPAAVFDGSAPEGLPAPHEPEEVGDMDDDSLIEHASERSAAADPKKVVLQEEPPHSHTAEHDPLAGHGMDDSLMDMGSSESNGAAEPMSATNPFEIVDGPRDLPLPCDQGLNPFLMGNGDMPTESNQVTNPFNIPEAGMGNGLGQPSQQVDDHVDDPGKPLVEAMVPTEAPQSEAKGEEHVERDSLEREDTSQFDPLKDWGQPIGLPAPGHPDKKNEGSAAATTDKKGRVPSKSSSPTKKGPDSRKAASAGAKPPPGSATARGKTGAPPSSTKAAPAKASADKKHASNGPAKDTSGPVAKPTAAATAKKTTSSRPISAPAGKADTSITSTKPTPRSGSGATKRPVAASASKAAPPPKPAAPLAPVTPYYMDLAYIPCHGDPGYVDMEFFRKVRARYYVLSAMNPSPALLDKLVDAKQTWEDESLEVTIIPTYDTDTLRHWMGLHREQLSKQKIDVAPSASRCTIQLQDHETSCAAYRLEF